jgi:ATP-dependent RNA helicase RhlE
MSSTTLSVKRQNHRVHPCAPERKAELLNVLLARHAGEKVLIVTAGEPQTLQEFAGETVTVTGDRQLENLSKETYDLLVSYDLPANAADYLVRLALVKTSAAILLDPAEQSRLYPIETLLGRTLMQETIAGFEPETPAAPERRSGRSGTDDSRRKARRGGSSADRKGGGNRKPRSSAKTGQRNHRYDGTPKGDEEKRRDGDTKKREGKARPYDAKKGGNAKGKKWDASKKPYKAAASGTKPPRDTAKKAAPKRPVRRITLKSQKPQ